MVGIELSFKYYCHHTFIAYVVVTVATTAPDLQYSWVVAG
jgi:hypothetical protein